MMRDAQPRCQQLFWSSVVCTQSLTSSLQLFVSKKLCGPSWELSAPFPAAGKQRGRGWAVPVCVGLQPGGICPSCSGIIALDSQVCPMSAFTQDTVPLGGWRGKQWCGHGRDTVSAAFGPESSSRDGFEADSCICCAGLQGCGTKALGAGSAPACSTGTERAVCCHSLPVTLMRVWAGRAEGAGLLLHVPACLSVCLPPVRGCWQLCVLAQLSPAVRPCWGSPAMALCGADSAVVFLGFPGIALSCPGLS